MNLEQRRAQTKEEWQTPYEEDEEEALIMANFLELLSNMEPLPAEQWAAHEQQRREQYEREVREPLATSDTIASTRAENREAVAAQLLGWPVAFRAKELDSGFVTSWQAGFDFDSEGIVWPERSIEWQKLEWIELDAAQLNENERKWLGTCVHEAHIAHSWAPPSVGNRCCFRFHTKSWPALERDGAVLLDAFP